MSPDGRRWRAPDREAASEGPDEDCDGEDIGAKNIVGRVGAGAAALAVLAAAVAFGTTGTAQAKGPAGTTPLGVGAVRILVGAVGLIAAVAVAGWSRRRSAGDRGAGVAGSVSSWWPRGRQWMVALVGGGGVALYQPAFFAGTQRNGVAVGTIVALGSGPLFVGVWEALWLRRRPSARWMAVTALALAGGSLLVGAQSADGDGGAMIEAFGVACSLAAGLGYAVYALAAKYLIDRGVASGTAMAWVFAAGAALLTPALVTEPLGWLGSARGAVMVAHLGLVTVTVAYLLYGYGLRGLPASTAVTITLAEPVTAAIAGVVVLGERLPALAWCGAALVALALVLTGRGAGTETAAVADIPSA